MLVEIEVPNIEKYNPRNDRGNHAWFRMTNDWYEDPKMFSLTPTQRYIWVSTVGVIHKFGKSGTLIAEIEWIALKLQVKVADLKVTLDKCHKNQLLKIGGNQVVTSVTPIGTATDRQTDRQLSVSKKTDEFVFESNALYLSYPRRGAKGKFLAGLKTKIKSEKDLLEFKIALENYKRYVAEQISDPQYIKLPTTFLNEWKDWLDPENGKVFLTKNKKEEVDWDLSGFE